MKNKKKSKRPYEKPRIERHSVKLNEVIMAACKDGIVGGVDGPNERKCQKGPTLCFDIALS